MMIGGAAHGMRNDWIEWVTFAAAAATAGAIFRFTGARLLRLGTQRRGVRRRRGRRSASAATPKQDTGIRRPPCTSPAAGLLALGLLAGLAPRLTGAAKRRQSTFRIAQAYADARAR